MSLCWAVIDGPDVPHEPLRTLLFGVISAASDSIRIMTPYFLPAAAGALATANLTMAMADDKVAAGASNAAQITAKLSAMRNASTGSYTLFVKAYDEAVAINAKIGATADEINQSASGLASATQALNTDVGQLATLVNA